MAPKESEMMKIMPGMHMTFHRDPAFVRIRCPADEPPMIIPPHWHEFHDEYHRVTSGRLKITYGRGQETRIVTPEDGENFTPRGIVHSLESFPGEELLFEERTVPEDTETWKEMFFRNLGTINWDKPNPFSIYQVYDYGDLKPGLPGHFKIFERLLVTVIGGYIAPFLGHRIKYDHRKSS